MVLAADIRLFVFYTWTALILLVDGCDMHAPARELFIRRGGNTNHQQEHCPRCHAIRRLRTGRRAPSVARLAYRHPKQEQGRGVDWTFHRLPLPQQHGLTVQRDGFMLLWPIAPTLATPP